MKISFFAALLSVACLFSALRAEPAADRAIEKALGASFVFATFFDGTLEFAAADGVVTLTGVVLATDEKLLAEDAAARSPGVARVQNKLIVRPAGPAGSDKWIEHQIGRRLIVRKGVSARNTRAEITRGAVELYGTVGNIEQKALTEEIVRAVPGVKSVVNNLVDNHPPGVSPHFGERLDDASVAAIVRHELRQLPALAATSVDVVVEGGNVTLAGEVANVDLVADAEKLSKALRGVRTVKNTLTVRR